MSPLRRPFCPPLAIAAAVGSAQRQKYDASCEICSIPGARAPTTYTPEPKPLDPPSRALVPPSHPTGYGYPPTPQSILQFFIFLLFVRVRPKLRNLLRPWGPCPYHLPPEPKPLDPPSLGPVPPPPTAPAPKPLNPLLQPRPLLYRHVHQANPEPKPLDPPSRALVPPPTPQGILQKKSFFFFLYALETSKIRCKLRNSVPGARAPTTYPPGTEALGHPPSPSLGPRGGCRASFLVFGGQGAWFTALSTRPAPAGTPPPHRTS